MPAPDLSVITDWIHDHPNVTRGVGLALVVGGYALAGDRANAMQALTALLVLFGVPALGTPSRFPPFRCSRCDRRRR